MTSVCQSQVFKLLVWERRIPYFIYLFPVLYKFQIFLSLLWFLINKANIDWKKKIKNRFFIFVCYCIYRSLESYDFFHRGMEFVNKFYKFYIIKKCNLGVVWYRNMILWFADGFWGVRKLIKPLFDINNLFFFDVALFLGQILKNFQDRRNL